MDEPPYPSGVCARAPQLIFVPLSAALLPRRVGETPVHLPAWLGSGLGVNEVLPLSTLLGTAAAFAIGISWYIFRRAPWAWAVQDGLSVGICVLFVRDSPLPAPPRAHNPPPAHTPTHTHLPALTHGIPRTTTSTPTPRAPLRTQVRTLRLPSLKIAALLLGLMFCYDIFMVFISRNGDRGLQP